MADMILLPCPDGWLALTPDVYAQGLKAARRTGVGANARDNSAQAVAAPIDEPLLDAAELARAFGVPVTRIAKAAREGEVPVVRIGRRVRYRRSEVEAYLRAQAQEDGK